jgi:hypothetical protein
MPSHHLAEQADDGALQKATARSMRRLKALRAIALPAAVVGLTSAVAQTSGEPRTNFFNDPFIQATSALKNCPAPEGPLYTAAEARAQAHIRAEKGTTCHYHGRCRLPNAYLYDAEIIPRVARFIQLDPRFKDSSIWLLGQRRWVYLQGCIASKALAEELVREVRLIDDVESVVDQLMPGTGGRPSYPVAAGTRP